jgi:hypothetical protein
MSINRYIKVIVWEPGKRLRGTKLRHRDELHVGANFVLREWYIKLGYDIGYVCSSEWTGFHVSNPIACVALSDDKFNAFLLRNGLTSPSFPDYGTPQAIYVGREFISSSTKITTPCVFFSTDYVDLTDNDVAMIYDNVRT